MRRHALPLALVALAVAARLPSVWRKPLWQDEVASARILREPTLLGALHHVARTESTPPLWYVLAWLVHHAGVPIADVRLLSVAFGGALAYVVFRLAETTLPRALAAAAAALIAIGTEPVFHGSELRAYELLTLLAAVLALVLVRQLQAPSRRLDVALALTVAAGCLTHYFFAYSLLTAVGWLWLDPRARAIRKRCTVAVGVAALAPLPWLPAFAAQYRHDRFWWIPHYSTRLVVVTPLRLFAPFGSRHVVLGLIVLAAIAAGVISLRRGPEARLLAALAVVPLVTAAGVWAAGERTFVLRNLMEITPFLAIVVVAGLAALPRPASLAAAAATVAAAGLGWWQQESLPPIPYQTIAHTLVADGWRPSDPIAVYGNFFRFRAPLEWYLPHTPRLDVSTATRRACAAIYVIAPRSDGDYAIVRVSHLTRPKGTTLLATQRAARCVRLSNNPRLEPLA